MNALEYKSLGRITLREMTKDPKLVFDGVFPFKLFSYIYTVSKTCLRRFLPMDTYDTNTGSRKLAL